MTGLSSLPAFSSQYSISTSLFSWVIVPLSYPFSGEIDIILFRGILFLSVFISPAINVTWDWVYISELKRTRLHNIVRSYYAQLEWLCTLSTPFTWRHHCQVICLINTLTRGRHHPNPTPPHSNPSSSIKPHPSNSIYRFSRRISPPKP